MLFLRTAKKLISRSDSDRNFWFDKIFFLTFVQYSKFWSSICLQNIDKWEEGNMEMDYPQLKLRVSTVVPKGTVWFDLQYYLNSTFG